MFWPLLPDIFSALAVPTMMTFPYEPSFPISGLKELCRTMQQTDCCNKPSAISQPWQRQWQCNPQRRWQQQHRLEQSLPALGPVDTVFTDIWRWGTGLFSSLFLWACKPGYDCHPCRPGFHRSDSYHVLVADISCLWFNLPGVCLYGLQQGFLPLPRGISAVLQWAYWHGVRWPCWSHQWLTDHSPPRSVGKEQNADTAVGMFSCFLTWGHL